MGRVTRDKGVNELLQAARSILKDSPRTWFLLVGEEEEEATLDQELYRWAKASGRILFTGVTDVVEQYMSAMDCFVLPSYREGFGMTVVEAEAMAVPVIVTNIPGPVDGVVENVTGFVVEKKDVPALEAAMRRMAAADLGYYGNNGVDLVRNGFEQKKLLSYILEDRKRLMHVRDEEH